jgi:hypothetical protein
LVVVFVPRRYLDVVFSFLWNIVVFNISPSPLELLGSLLIIAGCLTSVLPAALVKECGGRRRRKEGAEGEGEDCDEGMTEAGGLGDAEEGMGEGKEDDPTLEVELREATASP